MKITAKKKGALALFHSGDLFYIPPPPFGLSSERTRTSHFCVIFANILGSTMVMMVVSNLLWLQLGVFNAFSISISNSKIMDAFQQIKLCLLI